MTKTRVLIAGGGFAGLYAAKYLDKKLTRRLREYDFKLEPMLIMKANYTFTTKGDHYD